MLTKSENMRNEYCAQIVKIENLEPIENSDFLVKTIVGGGYQVVVGKNDVTVGDIMVYCKLETRVNSEFLAVNNQYDIGEFERNKNYQEVQELLNAGRQDEAKKLVGHFNKKGRVRMVKLRGCPSEGCLFTLDSLYKWDSKLKSFDFNKCFEPNEDGVIEPFNFDTINNKLFVDVYVPAEPNNGCGYGRKNKCNRKAVKRFNRLIEGQFSFHYDTNQLSDNMWRIKPDTVVTVSNKLHGTSHVVGNLLVRKPKPIDVVKKIFNKKLMHELKLLRKKNVRTYWGKKSQYDRIRKIKSILDDNYTVEYGRITSSRRVIKDQYINNGIQNHYYTPTAGCKDIHTEYGDLLFPYILPGITVYSEIVGYMTNSESMIQKSYDYGCNPGENFIMPYRITFTDNEGNKTEWEVEEVRGWTLNLLKDHPELQTRVKPINILYHGTFGDLYPDVSTEEHWNKNVLQMIRTDKDNFGMELDEPMCKHKVPREGIVVRIDNDKFAEAFKLKTYKFLGKEAELVDKGEVDMEMEQSY